MQKKLSEYQKLKVPVWIILISILFILNLMTKIFEALKFWR